MLQGWEDNMLESEQGRVYCSTSGSREVRGRARKEPGTSDKGQEGVGGSWKELMTHDFQDSSSVHPVLPVRLPMSLPVSGLGSADTQQNGAV